MEYKQLNVSSTRTVQLSDGRTESHTISYIITLTESDEDPQEAYGSVYRTINLQLNAWEKEIRETIDHQVHLSKEVPFIKTAASLLSSSDENEAEKEFKQVKTVICPKCKEIMIQKDGKQYYTCPQGHWGYLEMIKKGEVRT